ncbi:hypothetical protein BC834DRAFT_634556 [Gloeopeniophorella convolvens]|nr:hypothetical protein BC834DRAFT_634556 [Gloeopeniophorella convolvens]
MSIYLPVEIWTAIFEEVPDTHDLISARRASRMLCATATPFAFRVLFVAGTRRSAQGLKHLIESPQIAVHVKEIIYRDTGLDSKGKKLTYVRTSTIDALYDAFSAIYNLPLLETVSLTFFQSYGYWRGSDIPGHRKLQASVLDALALSFTRSQPNLKSLHLHNLHITHLGPLASPAIRTVLEHLSDLRISLLFDDTTDGSAFPAHWEHFWGTTLPERILTPTQSALISLTLHSDAHVGGDARLALADMRFAHLNALSLRRVVFDARTGAEVFILAHAQTLMRLELIGCKLPAPAYGSAHLPRAWADVWDKFEIELVGLRELRVDQRRSDRWGFNGPERRYVRAGPQMTFVEAEIGAESDAADAASLKRLHAAVAARVEAP